MQSADAAVGGHLGRSWAKLLCIITTVSVVHPSFLKVTKLTPCPLLFFKSNTVPTLKTLK